MPSFLELSNLINWLSAIFSRISGGNLIKYIVVEIGEWDMDATASVTVSYKQAVADINYKRVLGVMVQIFKDGSTESYFPDFVDGGMTSVYVDNSTKNVTLTRKASGFFDNTSYDETSSTSPVLESRGRITLCLST